MLTVAPKWKQPNDNSGEESKSQLWSVRPGEELKYGGRHASAGRGTEMIMTRGEVRHKSHIVRGSIQTRGPETERSPVVQGERQDWAVFACGCVWCFFFFM